MSEVKIKSNGLRNELKEIRKSIDKLTDAMIEIHIAQTNQQDEIFDNDDCCNDSELCKCEGDKPKEI